MPYARFVSTGSAVPDRELTNQDLERMVDTSDQWIRERTGIGARRVCGPETASSDLAVLAARRALEQGNVDPASIDLVLVATTTPDHPLFPNTACLVQNRLDLGKVPAFDISAACTGFVYALSVAHAYVRAGMFRKILFICVDTLSKFLDWEDRGTCILFGDGAGALVIEAVDDPAAESILSFDLHADGSGSHMLIVPEGGSRKPFDTRTLEARGQFLRMDGQAVFKFAVNVIVDSLQAALDKAGLKKEHIDYFIPHQANSRIIDFATKKLGLGPQQVKTNLERFGNTSSASIPLVIDEINRAGQLPRGKVLALVGFGAGLTWGSAMVRW